MQFPFFYSQTVASNDLIVLNEEQSKHAVQVLRMKVHDKLQLTDGLGHLHTAIIVDPHKRQCVVKVEATEFFHRTFPEITIAISLLKNHNRFEWFLEKAAELGVASIIPLICDRTEKQNFKIERSRNILLSALLQSRQVWMTHVSEPVAYTKFINQVSQHTKKYIAHCLEGEKQNVTGAKQDTIVLIGPEGDFTSDEIIAAMNQDYFPVTLGSTRLRTETAGVAAAVLLTNTY